MRRPGSSPDVEGELVEVLEQRPGGRSVLVRSEEEVHDDFACARDLAQARRRRSVPGIVESEIEKVERPVEGGFGERGPGVRPANGPADFAPDVAELLGKRQLAPPAGGKIAVLRAHRRTSRSTMRVMAARRSGSSTPRDRLPNEGRRLIIE